MGGQSNFGNAARGLALGSLLALLMACGHETSGTPPVALPTLQRPTLALTQDLDKRNLAIPTAALVSRGGWTGVYVLQDGQARFRLVRVGTVSRGQAQILSGLTGRETLVLGDLAPVHDGSPIEVVSKQSADRRRIR
jgi:hypothetical protein